MAHATHPAATHPARATHATTATAPGPGSRSRHRERIVAQGFVQLPCTRELHTFGGLGPQAAATSSREQNQHDARNHRAIDAATNIRSHPEVSTVVRGTVCSRPLAGVVTIRNELCH